MCPVAVAPAPSKQTPGLQLNVKKKKDWELIEDYIERKLREYSSTESITPVSCKTCGRLVKYQSKIEDSKGKRGWFK